MSVGTPSASTGAATNGKDIAYFHAPNPYRPASGPASAPMGVYVMDASGRNQRRVAAGLSIGFSWSPTGSRLVLDNDGGIYVVNRDGSGLRRVAKEGASPTWSPDESRIAFQHWDEGLYVVRSDGSGETRLTDPRFVADDSAPAWSPDGRLIAFVRSDDPSNKLAVVSPTGTNLRFLKNCFNVCGRPVWSPNARRIAFSDNFDIWTVNADGTDLTNVTDSPRQLEDFPTWSPSGRFLAFESRNRDTIRSLEVHTIRVDGTHRRNVSRASGRDEGPHWSPDGRSIVFSSIRDGSMDIWLTTATGKTPSNLTSHTQGSQNWWPKWSP